ncbi:acyl-CoA carboxylase subunit beta [Salibacterium salarium]|uniref:Acyl-CoA carboxylase subunit beta n=1 Tax=Salibacterium salarium TaxID=284579 RepID=A0A3R9PHT4_9BACI|nr:acyl-CoA carboxylase subunit beta [Salibacterium salarium]RSL30985.1 acyl-CoA carboxylase subunit beta [Salibacterium salarium]
MSDMLKRIKEMEEKRERMKQGGGQERIKAQHQRGKGTARERINTLVDEGTFIELNPFLKNNGAAETKHVTHGEGVVTGYAKIDGRQVFLFSQDFTVDGGALGEKHAFKIANVMDLAAENGAPIIGLNDSGGAKIQEGVLSLDGYGHIFYRNTKYSGVIPQISVIMGPCAGGAVYSPALTDFIFMVEKTSQMFITGPKVMESITGTTVDAESLGGAGIHAGVSGNAHFTASTEERVLTDVRRLLRFLPSDYKEKPPVQQTKQQGTVRLDKLLDIVPADSSKGYDIRSVLKCVLDEEEFMEVHAGFAKNMVIGFGRINGGTVGIVANNPKVMAGGLDIDSSDKCARFIRFCDSFHIPIITFEDVSGFIPGLQQEHQGIIRHGAKILYAYAEATVPKITVILRKAYGGAYVALNSKAIGADIVLAWPSAEIAVMGPAGAAPIIYGKEIEKSADSEETRRKKTEEYRDQFANPYIAAENGMVDDIIDPRDTRFHLVKTLEMLDCKDQVNFRKKHGNIPL